MIDVLIIGSGGAGLSAALNVKDKDNQVLVVSKTFPTHSQTCQAQGGINAVLNKENDSINSFINDTKKASRNLSSNKALEIFCNEATKSIKWLDEIAVPFSRDEENQIAQRKFGGTKAIRTCYSSDYTGLKILHTLYDQCIKKEIKFLNEYQLLNLIKKDGKVIGATFLDIVNTEVKEVLAKTTILASGGYSSLYKNFTTNSYASTGDGIICALNSGAKLSNLEFVQFHPTTLEDKNILISESARGEGGYLVDKDGKRFIDELKPRDEVSRAIYEKNLVGEKVYLDLRHLGLDKINETMPQERRLALEFLNLKMEEDLIPITPSAHYSMGGILTNEKSETTIENLFAIGECAQSGIHGANRLGGNSLQEIITFGRLCGMEASKKAKVCDDIYEKNTKQLLEDKNLIESIFSIKSKKNFYEVKNELGDKLFKNLGLFRDENRILEFQDYIKEVEDSFNDFGIEDKSRTYNKNLVEYIEFKNIIQLSKLIAKSALNRKESRGAHFRTDYPKESQEFEKNSIVSKLNETVKISFEDVV